ncbi:hypothetical protein PCASD_16433 [Puccinia coronata f. sp. avenae]|uniref:Uncharacterized protein n=1 Tax=Puccinia coronata f. sp. avenae TaxID=200324 RepID=A0A2N5TCN3_9BASI|nr:hypothetical protein PCASD_16433 [Puccinia coronata f. sp. avenae]
MATQTDTTSPRKSFLDRLIHKLDRIALDARPSSAKKPSNTIHHAHLHLPAHRHSASYQRPPAQSKTWYAPQPVLPSPTTPSDQPSAASPIRMPLPPPASSAPHLAPCLSPTRKPIAFPIPHPTGRRYSPSLGDTNRPVHLIASQANNSNSHSKNQASITIDLTSSSSSSESLHAGLPSANHAEAAQKKTRHGKGKKADILDASEVATPVKPDVDASHAHSALRTPTKSPGVQTSASSTPGRPSTERCAGTTKQGKPCSRKPMKTIGGAHDTKINVSESLDELDDLLARSTTPSGHPVDVVPRFCFQHYHMFQSQSGSYFAHSQWVEYSDWIDEQLPEGVKMALKMEMTKGPSAKDERERGYLYCHEMKPGGGIQGEIRTRTTHIKVGRSIRPVARLGEWAKQCPSREPIVRGFFPAAPPAPSATASGSSSPCYLNGAQQCAPHGARFHRKWERLVLLELAGWAALQLPHDNTKTNSNRKLPCIDCGKTHTEIFLLPLGSYERLVSPLIERWQRWCAFAYL